MSQSIFSDINPTTTNGTQLATLLNGFKDAVASGFSGTARPSNTQKGGYWVDTSLESAQNIFRLYLFDGTSDVLQYSINKLTGEITLPAISDGVTVNKYSADALPSAIVLKKSRGTSAAPTATQSGDSIGSVGARGYGATGFNSTDRSSVQFIATENHTDTANGSKVTISTTANTTATPKTRVTVDQDGGLSLHGDTSGAMKIKPASAVTDYTVTLPAAQGAASTVLTNDGSGNLSWSAGGGGSGANTTLSNLTSPTAINQNLIFNKTSPSISTPGVTASAANSEAITVVTGSATVDAFNSGGISIATGSATVGASGGIGVSTGSNSGGDPTGDITISTGTNAGAANSGNINITTGDAGDSSGNINLTTGPTVGSFVGQVNISAAQTNLLLHSLKVDSGYGIDFSATANGSGTTDSELLNDYEHGTFTPSISGTGTAGTPTYTSNRHGTYTKVGQIVHFSIHVEWTNLTGATGNLQVTGLPFTSNSTAARQYAVAVYNNGVTLTAGSQLQAAIAASQTRVDLTQFLVTTGAVSSVAIDTTGRFILSGSYTV